MSQRLTEDFITHRLKKTYHPGSLAWTDGYADLFSSQSDRPLKCAAVLMPLTWREEAWHLVFTRRTDTVESHKGQVSFPGGGCDTNETSAEQTALREAEEEIGLHARDVCILGQLNDMVTITRYQVSPVVGIIPWPYKFLMSPREVSRVFTIPLTWLAQPENWEEHHATPKGAPRSFPVVIYHPYDGEILWGASARMTLELLRVIGMLGK